MPAKPRWKPTDDQIKTIKFLAGCGWNEEKLSEYLGVHKTTFERAQKRNAALREAVITGRHAANAKVIQTTFEMAISKKHPAINIFWLKTRERWRQADRVEHTHEHKGLLGQPGEPSEKVDRVVEQFKGLLEAFQTLPKKEE